MVKTKIFLTLVLTLFLFTATGLAIEQYGVLSGRVADEQGKGLPGVEVTVSGPAQMGTRTTLTNNQGDYRFGKMNVGQKYVLTFKLDGFKEVVREDIRIELAKETTIGVLMEMGAITERIVVTGEIPIVDPKSSTNQVNISREVVETLANDRQYQTIMEMMPGAIPGNNPAMMGADTSDNMYQFDGMESTDPLTKTWSTAMNFDNFEEMQVVAQGAPAEYGRGTGAVINVVTKSGSNEIHGTARIHISKVDWNAKAVERNTSFDDSTHYLNETRPALNIGGPIIKNHIWFFGSWERRNKWKPATWWTNPTEALNNTPTGKGKGYYQGHYASAKLTVSLGNFSLMGMWSEDPITMPEYRKYGNNAGQAHANELEKTQGGWNFNSEATTTFGPNTYLVARFSMKRGSLNLQSFEQTGIRYQQSGYYWGAGYYDYKTGRDHNQFIVNLSHFMETGFGYHDLKLGFEIYDLNVMGAINYSYPGGEYIRYNQYGQTYRRYIYETGAPKTVMKYTDMVTIFFQDKWEVTKGLTLNLGLRIEQGTWKNHAKETILKYGFGDMIAPRLGAAYSFGKNKIHANWGRFYDLYMFYLVDNNQPDIFQRKYDYYRGEHYGYPEWEKIRSYWSTPPAGATTMDDNLGCQHMDEISIGYERILSNKFSLGISYMHRAWKNKLEDFDPDGDDEWHFANADNFEDQNGTNWGKTFRKYDAFIVTLKKNLGDDKFQFMASYTWSKLKGFSGVDGESDWGDDPYEHVNALGYLGNDTRHQLRFNGSIILPLDITLGASLYWFSGYPYTEYVNMLYLDPPDIPEPTGHNNQYYGYRIDPRGTSGRYPSEWRLDLRVEKKFKIKKLFTVSVYADMFNVLNQQNELERDNNLGEAELTGAIGSNDYVMTYNRGSYGNYTDYFAPMSFFVGAKIEW
ncbi:MAG: TonB-dependent receptor [bacterium]|nr:TonB-dependent receptor [bacterium]